MRPLTVLQAVIYGLVVVTGGISADFAINVVTGGSLPGPLAHYGFLAWPTLGVLFVVSVAAAVGERLRNTSGVAEKAGEGFRVQVPRLVVGRRGPQRAHGTWVSEDRRSPAATRGPQEIAGAPPASGSPG